MCSYLCVCIYVCICVCVIAKFNYDLFLLETFLEDDAITLKRIDL
jgi:hypothetical protein